MSAQDFNFVPEFPQNCAVSSRKYCIFCIKKNFGQKEKFSNGLKVLGGNCPSPCHDATVSDRQKDMQETDRQSPITTHHRQRDRQIDSRQLQHNMQQLNCVSQ